MIVRWLAIRLTAARSLFVRRKAVQTTGSSWLQTMRHLGGGLKRFPRLKINAFRELWRLRRQRAASRQAPQPAPVQAPPVAPFVQKPFKTRSSFPRRLIKLCALILFFVAAAPFVMIVVYRYINPPMSALMAYQKMSGAPVIHQWRSLDEMSQELVVAVVVSEDAQFCKHRGVDWSAVEEALAQAEDGGKPRGASTIPMQTVKNLFFWPGRSYTRKIAEPPLAYFMSWVWPKDRVMEVYLNIVEWGPGVFGAESAARRHFRKTAAQLNGFEAASMAASLPNPILRNAGKPGPQVNRLIGRLRKRVAVERRHAKCVVDRMSPVIVADRPGGSFNASPAGSSVHKPDPGKQEPPKQERPKQDSPKQDVARPDPRAKTPSARDPWSNDSEGRDFGSRDSGSRDSWSRDPSSRDSRAKDQWRSDQRGGDQKGTDQRGSDRWGGGQWDSGRDDRKRRDAPSDRDRYLPWD
jgi:monofunctional glycosyltransferase